MEALVEQLAVRFDYVIIDAPPLLPVTDAAVLSTIVDGALIVVGAGVVSRDQLTHAIASLEAVNGKVLGLILNRVAATGGNSYGTYSYHYEAETERATAKGRRERGHVTPVAAEASGAAPVGGGAPAQRVERAGSRHTVGARSGILTRCARRRRHQVEAVRPMPRYSQPASDHARASSAFRPSMMRGTATSDLARAGSRAT